jgi:sugar/nucleoside kinase (ribokinase family)
MWSAADPRIVLAPPRSSPLFERCAAIVISEAERTSCEGLLRDRAGEAIAVVTDAAAPTELQLPGGEQVRLPVPPVSPIRDDMGAGDVFAAAFFIALAEGEQPIRAAGFATAAAAVRVAGEGPAAVGERAAIEARVAAVA